MSLMSISPAMSKTISAPVKNNLLRRLRVPALAAAMVLGGSFANKIQAKESRKDTFTPVSTCVNDTIKPKTNGNIIFTDTIVFTENDTLSAIDELSEDIAKINTNALGLNTSGSASEELYMKVLSNISESGDNPYSAIYLALNKQSGIDSNTSDLNNQMDDIIENMKLYTRDQNDETDSLMIANGSITEFKYGKDNSKTGTIFQTINISGINLNNDKDKNNSSNDTINEKDNNFNGNVSYRMKTVTDKAEVETNINAGSENVDIQLAAMYKTKTQNGGDLSLSANGRETMNGSVTCGSAGASIDYSKDKFATGLYYYYNRESDKTDSNFQHSELDGFVKYKQNIDLHAGIQIYHYIKYYYYYSKLNLAGTKKLEDINMKLSGALSAEAGIYNFNLNGFGENNTKHTNLNLNSFGEDNLKYTNLDFSAMAGAYFKTDDINASLNGRASYSYLIDEDGNNEQDLGLSVLGAFSKGNIAVSAMLSMFKDIYSDNDQSDNSKQKDVTIATSVGFEVKDLLKGITPQFSYTSTSINNKVQHFFNVTVKTSIEALKKAQK